MLLALAPSTFFNEVSFPCRDYPSSFQRTSFVQARVFKASVYERGPLPMHQHDGCELNKHMQEKIKPESHAQKHNKIGKPPRRATMLTQAQKRERARTRTAHRRDCKTHVSKQASGGSRSRKRARVMCLQHRKRVENKEICKTSQDNTTHANTRNHACKMKHCSSKAHPNLQCEPVRASRRNALQIAQMA